MRSCLLADGPIGDDRRLDSRPEYFRRHGGCSGGRDSFASWRWSLRRSVGSRGSFSSSSDRDREDRTVLNREIRLKLWTQNRVINNPTILNWALDSTSC